MEDRLEEAIWTRTGRARTRGPGHRHHDFAPDRLLTHRGRGLDRRPDVEVGAAIVDETVRQEEVVEEEELLGAGGRRAIVAMAAVAEVQAVDRVGAESSASTKCGFECNDMAQGYTRSDVKVLTQASYEPLYD